MVTAVTQNVGNCPGPGFQRAVKRLWLRFFCNFSLATQRKVYFQYAFSIRIFNTHQRFCLSLLRQPDRWVRAKVQSVHQPISAQQIIHRRKKTAAQAAVFCVGIDLSSRSVSRQVLSALVSLTSVFGMGTGGPSPLKTPTIEALYPQN